MASVFEVLFSLYQTKGNSLKIVDVLDALKEAEYLNETELNDLLKFQQKPQAASIFISYRRQYSRWFTRQLHQALEKAFLNHQIFWDLELALGEDFTLAIEKAIEESTVLLAVIGNSWLKAQDETGQRRLDNPYDYVRLEIANALKRPMLVIPILIDKTAMPQATELPDDLQDLVKRQALEVDEKRFRHDVDVLIQQLQAYFEKN